MKKTALKLMMAITVLAPMVASAEGVSALGTPVAAVSGHLKSDLILLKDDAAKALETGVISIELQTRVTEMRQDNPELFDASDLDIIEIMFVGVQ